MQSKANKKGYYIVTQKRRLYTNYEQYIKITQEIFNETALRYFNLIFEHLEFLELSNQKCLRELEKLTLKSKNGIKPENYFDLDVPVYLRRAAINYAIGSAKTYQEKYKAYLETKDKNPNLKMPTKFNASIVCYKGMYKDFAEGSLKVKLFNGKTWNWYKANIRDTNSKENNEILSPTIVLNKEYVMIHIPTKKEVKDVSPIKSRMYKKNIRVCGVAFSNSDSFAICVVIDKEKNIIKTKFIKGGNEYRKQTSIILKQSKVLAKIKQH